MGTFRKFLVISHETSRLTGEGYSLEKISWQDVEKLPNFSDHDGVLLNLQALHQMRRAKPSPQDYQIEKAFDPQAWAHVVSAGGQIVVAGNPDVVPFNRVMRIGKDERPLEYRRVQRDEEIESKVQDYMDRVAAWSYSIVTFALSDTFKAQLKRHSCVEELVPYGHTSYSTALGLRVRFQSGVKTGAVYVLPSLDVDPASIDTLVIREWFGISTALSEPDWVRPLRIPGEEAIRKAIADKNDQLLAVRVDVAAEEKRLMQCRRWYRLLFDDGETLEKIVKESFELLGASVKKTSKEKDDYRLQIPGQVDAILEVKGTHNARFGIGALRQLTGWIDEATAKEGRIFRGVFIGNAGRKDPPSQRAGLFENNGEIYAALKEFVTIRTMDLLCVVMLHQLALLDLQDFWRKFFATKGLFDASHYWKLLPEELAILHRNQDDGEKRDGAKKTKT